MHGAYTHQMLLGKHINSDRNDQYKSHIRIVTVMRFEVAIANDVGDRYCRRQCFCSKYIWWCQHLFEYIYVYMYICNIILIPRFKDKSWVDVRSGQSKYVFVSFVLIDRFRHSGAFN